MARRWNNDRPIYLQIKEEMICLMLEGAFAEGEAVISARQLASAYDLNPLTVTKAYQELVQDNILERKRGVGMFVAKGVYKRLLEQERKNFLNNEWPAIVRRMRAMNLDVTTLTNHVGRKKTKPDNLLAALLRAKEN